MSAQIVDTLSLGKIVQIREKLLKAAAGGKKVYRLESGDPSFEPAPHVLEAVCRAAHSKKTHYVPNAGIPELRQAFKRKVEEENGIAVESVENVFITNGAMHALFVVFQSILDEDSEVLLPDPMWTEVAENIRLAGGRPVYVPLRREKEYEYEPAEIERRITPKTRAIFINTPHNPTGAVLSPSTLGAIVDIAAHHNLWVVSDEAYEHILYEPNRHFSIASLAGHWAPRVLSIFSFSKSHAMAGLRVGGVIAHSNIICERLHKLLRCSINGVNSLAQWAALAALQGDASHQKMMAAEYLQRRDTLLEALQGIPGVSTFEPKGTFFAWVELERSLLDRLGLETVDQLSGLLCDHGIGNTPGNAFGIECENAMRFSFSCDSAMVRDGAEALRSVLLG